MKNKILIGQALAGMLLISLTTGCASGPFNWLGSLAGHGPDSTGASYSQTIPSPPADGVARSQKLCPVTGEPLDSMGGSIPVSANGETIYVCCQGCVKAVKKDPQKYLAIVRNES